MSKKLLIPLAAGFEELEFVGLADVCKRASDAGGDLEVVVASLDTDTLVRGGTNIYVKADTNLDSLDLNSFDAIAMPGGFEGMNNLKNNSKIIELIKKLDSEKKLVAAICASPIVLNTAGVLRGDFTCYPGCEDGISANRIEKKVVVNENVITSMGPSTVVFFGLEIVRYLCGDDVYKNLYDGMLAYTIDSKDY